MHPAATQPLLNLKQKQHPQETPHSDSSTQPAPTTNMPDPKGRHATRPILEVRTPIAALSGENTMFRANPSVQNSSLIKQFQCDQPTMSWNSTQLYSILLCSTLLYSTLLYRTLLYSTLLTSGKCQLGLKTSELLLYRRNMPTGLEIQNISYKFILLTVFFYDFFYE